ncbi:hypothetical protein D3C80_2034780 [compost metagenome]
MTMTMDGWLNYKNTIQIQDKCLVVSQKQYRIEIKTHRGERKKKQEQQSGATHSHTHIH